MTAVDAQMFAVVVKSQLNAVASALPAKSVIPVVSIAWYSADLTSALGAGVKRTSRPLTLTIPFTGLLISSVT